jgi:YVTN family beta-propeller protein
MKASATPRANNSPFTRVRRYKTRQFIIGVVIILFAALLIAPLNGYTQKSKLPENVRLDSSDQAWPQTAYLIQNSYTIDRQEANKSKQTKQDRISHNSLNSRDSSPTIILPFGTNDSGQVTLSASCGFVNTPKDPSPADCSTSLTPWDGDSTNLNNRIPLILIHGIHDDPSRFNNLVHFLTNNTGGLNFNGKFKIYKFQYQSDVYPIWEIARSLRNRIDDLVKQNQSQLSSKKFWIIAHSMGGLVARSYMNEHDTDFGAFAGRRAGERIEKLITLATPHHGTQGASRFPRLDGPHPVWGAALNAIDWVYWISRGCTPCDGDTTHPNRAELRWDNFNHDWDTNSGYTSNLSTERNTWLQNISHSFDGKITAYWGYIGVNPDVTDLGAKSPHELAEELYFRHDANDEHGLLTVSGVVLQRVMNIDFNSPITTLYNDGFVPTISAKFDRPPGSNWPTIAKQVGCRGYDHKDMVEGKNALCGTTGKSLFNSILDDLQLQPVPPPSVSTLEISGNGSFGYVQVGSSQTKNFTLTNTGNTSLSVSNLGVSGTNASQFSTVNPPSLPFDIPANSSRSISVKFNPTSVINATATLSAANNSSNPNATFNLFGNSVQAGCSYSLSSTGRSMGATGGQGSFTVSATGGCTWTARTDFSWITVSTAGQNVNFAVASNSPGGLRVGTIIVQAGNTIFTFTITQDGTSSGCNVSLSGNYQNFNSNGGGGSFNVTTQNGCLWSASSDSSWISINTGGLMVGTQPLNYTVTANPNNSLRYGTIRIQGQTSSQVYTVSQDGSTNVCSYTLSATEQSFNSTGGQNSFTITAPSGCAWRASSNNNWINIISNTNGIGSQTVTYSVASNPSTSSRLGGISIQGGSDSQTVIVNQDGQPIAYPSITLPTTNFQMGDALLNTTIYQSVTINNNGPGYLFLGSVYLSSGNTDFDVLPYGQNQIIAPGGSTSVTIRLTPSSTGSRSATFSVTSNDPNNPSVNFSISGNGVTQLTGGIDFVWSNKFTIPNQATISQVTGVTINNNIYVVGGNDYKYDPTANTWTQIASQPFAQYGAADVINGKIYLVGFDPFSTTTRVVIYDPASDSWSTGATMPALRLDIAVTAANGKVYVFGGRSGTGADPVTSSVYEYTPSTNTWATKTNMPTARMGAVAISLNGLIYVIGGNNGARNLQVNEVYNPANDTWITREQMPNPRSWPTAFVLNSKIYVAGGNGSDGQSSRNDLVEEFDPSKADAPIPGALNAWAERNHLITGRATCASGVVNNKAYVIGGINFSGTPIYTIEEGVLAASPKINVPVTTFNCGDVPLGNFCDKRIEVQNEGNALLTISHWGLSAGSSDFNAFAGTNSVDAGQSISLVVRFVPSSTGSKSATFSINSNDPNTPTLTFNLSANAVAAPTTNGTWQSVNTIHLSNAATNPTQIAIANGKAYVSRFPGTVSIIDLSSGATISDIKFSAYPNSDVQSVAISGNRAYVVLGNIVPGEVAVVNTDNNTVLSYVAISGVHAAGIAATATNIYVPNAGPDTVSVIDQSTNSVTKTISVSAGAVWIAIDSNSGKAYVTGNKPCGTAGGGCVSVIDTNTNSVVSTISIPTPYTSQVGIALSGTRAYFLTDASVEVIDLSSNSVVASIPVPRSTNGNAIAVTPGYVLVGSGYVSGATVTVISTSTNFIVGELNITNPSSIAVDPATGLVYVVDYNDSTISVLRFIAPGFSVSTNSQSLAANAGGSTAFNTTVTSIDGFSGPVTLSCEGLPTGATCQFAQNPVSVPANGSVSTALTVNVPAGTISGPYSLRVVGSGSITQNIQNIASDSKTKSANDTQTTTATDFQNLSLTVPSCDFALSTQSVSVGSDASTGSVNLGGTTGCSWTAVSNVPWISITSGASGTGNSAVGYSIAANTSSLPRTGTLTIGGQTFTITQAGVPCNFSLTTSTSTLSSGSGTGSVNLIAAASDCSWSATSNANWIIITSTASGAGSGSISYSVTANPSSAARQGTLTIAGQTFTVNQAGTVCSFSISSTAQSFDSSGGSGSVNIGASASDCGWSASSNVSWVTITSGLNGTGNGTVSYQVAANPNATARNGMLTLGGVPFTVVQAGVPSPTIQFSASTYTFSEGDGRATITVNRTGDTSGVATVNYATSDTAGLAPCSLFNGVASSRCDYATTIGTLQFAAGEASKNIFIPLVDDSYAEGTESFTISLSNPAGAALGAISTATISITDNETITGANPIDQTNFFIREHYIDFLGREPDPPGFAGWQNVMNNCGITIAPPCDRIEVSSDFFRSEEFQTRGYFIYRFFKVLPSVTDPNNPQNGHIPHYSEYMPDLARVSGFLSADQLEASKVAFINDFMARSEFQSAYGSLTDPTAYVTALLNTVGLPNHPTKQTWITNLTNGSMTRAQVLRALVESGEMYNKNYNEAFVIMQYFGYLRRDADGSYVNWIQTMNQNNGDYRVMINGFMNSLEYRLRFGP